ncbi:hypothetical protein BC835DRAFT_1404784 [Cytidiella melzeri]|nr:hypothetical protein BC835DRAFT_1404784 [Cytidiella melzeri]
MSATRAWSLYTIAAVTVVTGVIAYAAYFDYKRRNDADFRKKLRKDKKRIEKATAKKPMNVSQDELRAAIAKIRAEEVPETPQDREAYFMHHVGLAEKLCMQGPESALIAAMSFFRGLRVYPSPVELLMIYQKTIPEEVFKAPTAKLQEDDEAPETSPERSGPPSETSSQEWDRLTDPGYYKFFPAKHFNVSVQDQGHKKVLIAEKDFMAGDVIYTEEAVVAALDADLQEAGTHCTHCLRLVHKGDSVTADNDPLNAVYCSKECQTKSKLQSHRCLFLPEPLLPPEMGSTMDMHARSGGQQAFAKYIKESKRTHPLLVARFAARQIATEIDKLSQQGMKPSDELDLPQLVEKGSPEYALGDHFERLRYVERQVSEDETKVIQGVFSNSLPGLDQFLTDERHGIMLSKVAYNAIGVAFSGGRDDRPVFQARPEDQERTRTPYGTDRQVGSALYMVSAYIGHSCDPCTKPSFKNGTSELHLVATRPIKKGEELTMAYVDVTQRADETAEEARRRRRYELARGWRFKCECTRCTADTVAAADENLGVDKDESKLEASVERFATGQVLTRSGESETD